MTPPDRDPTAEAAPRTEAGRALIDGIVGPATGWVLDVFRAERREDLGVAILAIEAEADVLGAAWRRAEAALPEDWRLAVQRTDEDYAVWAATGVSPAFFNGLNDDEYADGQGSTPAAALIALVEKLSERP